MSIYIIYIFVDQFIYLVLCMRMLIKDKKNLKHLETQLIYLLETLLSKSFLHLRNSL